MRTFPGRISKRVFVGILVSLALLLVTSSALAVDEARAQPAKVEKKPTVLGSWKLMCENANGMVVDIVSTGTTTAVGRVKVLGRGARFHYKLGDEIMRLSTAAGGTWTGQVYWRNASVHKRWQPITMRLVGDRLHGVTESEYCYEYMERPR